MPAERGHGGGEGRPVGIGEPRLDGRRSCPRGCRAAVACPVGSGDPGAHPAVAGEEVDAVAGAWPASAASSSAASMAASSRGASPTRPALVREVSSTSTTRRSLLGLPGAHDDDAGRGRVARQSIERTSSPSTYSRRRVELGALAAHPHRRPAVELAQPAPVDWAGACVRGKRQRPDRAGHVGRPLPRGQAQRAARRER